MQLTCPYSSVRFACSWFPTERISVPHPVFQLPFSALGTLYTKWENLESPGPVEDYLLCLAGMNSTGLILWAEAASPVDVTHSIVARQLSPLFAMLREFHVLNVSPALFPRYAISHASETDTLRDLDGWIWAVNEVLTFHKKSYLEQERETRSTRRRVTLEELSQMELSKEGLAQYAEKLASWADVAYEFPEFLVSDPRNAYKQIPLSVYWRWIIRCAVTRTHLDKLHLADVDELAEHILRTDTLTGTLPSAILRALDGLADCINEFWDIGDPLRPMNSFQIEGLFSGDGFSDSPPLQRAAIAQAQTVLAIPPVRKNFSTDAAYHLAMAKYNFAMFAKSKGLK